MEIVGSYPCRTCQIRVAPNKQQQQECFRLPQFPLPPYHWQNHHSLSQYVCHTLPGWEHGWQWETPPTEPGLPTQRRYRLVYVMGSGG